MVGDSDSSDEEEEMSAKRMREADQLFNRSFSLLDLFELFDSSASADSFSAEVSSTEDDVEFAFSSFND